MASRVTFANSAVSPSTPKVVHTTTQMPSVLSTTCAAIHFLNVELTRHSFPLMIRETTSASPPGLRRNVTIHPQTCSLFPDPISFYKTCHFRVASPDFVTMCRCKAFRIFSRSHNACNICFSHLLCVFRLWRCYKYYQASSIPRNFQVITTPNP